MILVAPWVHLTGLGPLGSKGNMSFLITPPNVSVLIVTWPTWVLHLLSTNCGESGQRLFLLTRFETRAALDSPGNGVNHTRRRWQRGMVPRGKCGGAVGRVRGDGFQANKSNRDLTSQPFEDFCITFWSMRLFPCLAAVGFFFLSLCAGHGSWIKP